MLFSKRVSVSRTKKVSGTRKHPWHFWIQDAMIRLALAVELKTTAGAREPCPERKGLRYLDFENFPLNVCQCHKSRSRSSELTADVTTPLNLPS